MSSKHLEANVLTLFEGIYVQHWEVARFAVVRGRKWFGLLPRIVLFSPVFDAQALREHGVEPLTDNLGVTYYRMTVRGRLGPPGSFGHMGICRHELHVDEILKCEKTDDPGPTW